jgi:hypothetical protein
MGRHGRHLGHLAAALDGPRGLTDGLRRVAGLEGAVLVEFNEAVCALEATPVLGDGAYEVRFEAPGTCTITVAVPGETGFSESWTVEVAAAP